MPCLWVAVAPVAGLNRIAHVGARSLDLDFLGYFIFFLVSPLVNMRLRAAAPLWGGVMLCNLDPFIQGPNMLLPGNVLTRGAGQFIVLPLLGFIHLLLKTLMTLNYGPTNYEH